MTQINRQAVDRSDPPGGAGERENAAISAVSQEPPAFPSTEDLLISHPPLVGERIWKDHAELFDAENRALVKHAASLMFGYKLPKHLAEDIVQEAWTDLIARWDGVERPLPWMYAVVKKKAHRLAGTMTRQAEGETAAAYAGRAAPPPAVSMDTIVALHDTLREVAALPEKQRTAIVLRFLEDRPYAEVADLMLIDRNTVGPHIHRARSRLRERLGDLGLAVLALATLVGVPTPRTLNPATGQGEALTGPHDFRTAAPTGWTSADDEATSAEAALQAKVDELQKQIRADVQPFLERGQQGMSETLELALEASPDSYIDAALSAMSDDEREAALETLRQALGAYAPDSAEVERVYAA